MSVTWLNVIIVSVIRLIVVMLCVTMLSFFTILQQTDNYDCSSDVGCQNAMLHYVECHYAGGRFAESHFKCHNAVLHYVESHYAEGPFTESHSKCLC